MMIRSALMAATAALTLSATAAMAQNCGGTYVVKRGDTLSQISDRLYRDARKWSAIYGNNLAAIGRNPNTIRIGERLNLTCIGGLPVGLEQASLVVEEPVVEAEVAETETQTEVAAIAPETPTAAPAVGSRKLTLLTADDYAPFTDRDLENGGMFNQIVNTSMKNTSESDNFEIYWVNDWGAHLKPLLSDNVLDMGYPWAQPDCASTPDEFRCANFEFSKPMFEMLILLFTDKERPIKFTADSDIEGKTLCRPNGYFVHDLNKNGRNWISENKITLKQPVAVSDCFEMLLDGEVDAVAMNEFTGRAAIKSLDLAEKVNVVSSRPLSIEGLHVVVHKTHPQVDELITMVNGGLDRIKASGEYQSIIDTHMSRIWEDF